MFIGVSIFRVREYVYKIVRFASEKWLQRIQRTYMDNHPDPSCFNFISQPVYISHIGRQVDGSKSNNQNPYFIIKFSA